jgi:hypothetical protein
MNSIDASLQFQKIIWLGVIAIGAVFVGALLGQGQQYGLLLLSGLALWVLLLPYHTTLATILSVATFGSALILPMMGRPYWWEFSALLGWSGLVLTIALRRYNPDAADVVRRHKWMFLGAIAYCLTLVVIMRYRGVGFRVFGGSQIGGRLYFQQLACAIFPLLFALRPLSARDTLRLFTVQCLLSGSFLVSDFVFSYGSTGLWNLLLFFELPNDGVNFENQSLQFGIRRFQSLYFVAQAMLLLLFVRQPLSNFARAKTLWLWPVGLGLLGMGLLAGHRYLLVNMSLLLLFCAWGQRFFSIQRIGVAAIVLGATLVFTYIFAEQLPLAAQRTLSLLPGIEVNRIARADGEATWQGRKEIRELGWKLAPQYKWMGRGFAKNEGWAYVGSGPGLLEADTFYNGFIGLLVNTGIPGTLTMTIFLAAGTAVAFRILTRLRRFGCPDHFARLCCVLAGQWIATVIIFYLLHGDSEFAMRTFSLQAGLLLCCEYNLRKRLNEATVAESQAIAAPAAA